MNRTLFRKWSIWLLPILALRAFLPVGFMLTADAGGLHLVFCPSQSAPLASAVAVESAQEHAGHGVDHSQHFAQHAAGAGNHASHAGSDAERMEPLCPFALAALALAVDAPHLDEIALRPTDEIVQPRLILVAGVGPARADRIRGPPLFS